MSKLDLYKSWQNKLGIDPSAQKYNLEALIELTANGAIGGGTQSLVEEMPGYDTKLQGLWLFGHDPTNQTVKDWSGNGYDALRGNSTTPNTSSPEGTNFDGNDFAQTPDLPTMNDVTIGVVFENTGVGGVYSTLNDNYYKQALYLYSSELRVFNFNSVRINRPSGLTHVMSSSSSYYPNVWVDGSSVSTFSNSSYGLTSFNGGLQIGKYWSDHMTGSIYAVYIYNDTMDSDAAAIDTKINEILATL